MRPFVVICTCCALSLVGCAKKPNSIVVLDQWWNTDYAKNMCGTLLPMGFNDPGLTACENQQAAALQEFERELLTQFAARPECTGVRMLGFKQPTDISPEVDKAIRGQYWNLSINYSTQESLKQQWQMIRSPKGAAVQQGEGTPQEIARDVCSIVSGRGASVADF